MKLKFKEGILYRYSSLDLEYGLTVLKAELSDFNQAIKAYKKAGASTYYIDRYEKEAGDVIKNKIKIVEDEIVTRMLLSD